LNGQVTPGGGRGRGWVEAASSDGPIISVSVKPGGGRGRGCVEAAPSEDPIVSVSVFYHAS